MVTARKFFKDHDYDVKVQRVRVREIYWVHHMAHGASGGLAYNDEDNQDESCTIRECEGEMPADWRWRLTWISRD
jgi:hypothetical protein